MRGKIDSQAALSPTSYFTWGTRLRDEKFSEAEDAFGKCADGEDPARKAKVLIALGAVKISAHKPMTPKGSPKKSWRCNQGRVNAEARLLAGEVQQARKFRRRRQAFRASLSFPTIPPSLRLGQAAWRIGKPAKLKKQIACRASCAALPKLRRRITQG